MGLDVPNIRMVIHWQHPSSIEDYLQEFGRAGRDGKASVAVLLHNRNNAQRDIGLLRFMAARAVESAPLSSPQPRLRPITKSLKSTKWHV